MSQYLIDRIEATTNIEVLTNTEVVALSGSPHGSARAHPVASPSSRAMRPKRLFVISFFLLAPRQRRVGCMAAFRSTPKASFKPARAYRRQDVRSDNSAALPLSLQSSVAGVFAVGDVRSGSVKRVGAAIGEGAAVVAQLHAYLTTTRDRVVLP